MSRQTAHGLITQELLDAMADAKRSPDRAGASEFGPGYSRNRADVAPLVDREHRRAAEAAHVPIRVSDGRPHPGRARPRVSDLTDPPGAVR